MDIKTIEQVLLFIEDNCPDVFNIDQKYVCAVMDSCLDCWLNAINKNRD